MSRSRIDLSWTAASDDKTAVASLLYKVVTAGSTAALDTVAEADAISGGSLLLDWTANTTSRSVTGLTAGTTYAFAVLVKDGDGEISLYTPGSVATLSYYRMFVTAITFTGNTGGISGADSSCSTDSNKPSAGTYKALLAAATRVACTTANCGGGVGEHTDWVLQPSAQYARTNGTAIGTTTAAGVFSFPISNSFGTSGNLWTGLASDWTNSSNCNNWISDSGANGIEGSLTVTTSSALSIATSPCGVSDYLVCVEQ